jgi:hypothetical protein
MVNEDRYVGHKYSKYSILLSLATWSPAHDNSEVQYEEKNGLVLRKE